MPLQATVLGSALGITLHPPVSPNLPQEGWVHSHLEPQGMRQGMGAGTLGAEAMLTPPFQQLQSRGGRAGDQCRHPATSRFLSQCASLSNGAVSRVEGGSSLLCQHDGKTGLSPVTSEDQLCPGPCFEEWGKLPEARRPCSSPISPESMGWCPGSHWYARDSHPQHPPSQAPQCVGLGTCVFPRLEFQCGVN